MAAGLLLWAAPAAAQLRSDAEPAPDTLRVADVRIEGPRVLPLETLLAAVRTKPNRRLLNVPGATWWLWLYRAGERRTGRLGRALRAAGEAPAVADAALVAADAERLRALLSQEGYRRAVVTARLDTLRREPRVRERPVRVVFALAPGPATRIARAVYDAPGALAFDLARGSLLGAPEGGVAAGTLRTFSGATFVPEAGRYSERTLVEERQRVLALLRDRGFAAATADSVEAFLDGAPDDTLLALALRVRPGRTFRFGGVEAEVEGPEPAVRRREARWNTAQDPRLGVAVSIVAEPIVTPRLVDDVLAAAPGTPYRASALADTKRRLDATGLFSFTDVVPVWADTFRLDGVTHLPHRLVLRTQPRHGLRLDAFVLQRTGVTTGDGELGLGLGGSYENLNLFGRGEAFRVRASGSVAGALDAGLATNRQFEVSASIAAPYGALPLGRLLARRGDGTRRAVRTTAQVALLTARRDELRLNLKARLSGRLRYDLVHSPRLTSALDLPDVTLSNPDTLAGFTEAFLGRLRASRLDTVEYVRLLEDYTRPSANAALRYTLRYTTAEPVLRRSGVSAEASVSAGGFLEALADRYVFAPDTLSYTVPGPGGGDLVYRPYVRFTGDVRRYWSRSPITVVAARLTGGTALALGGTGLVPFDQRFYAGGASSVRGWGLRELGPGGASAPRGVANVLGGDVRLEAAAEVRRTLLPLLFGAEWQGAAFLDAGNVWLRADNPGATDRRARFRLPDALGEVGVGTGLGLRLAYPFLVIRFDAAVRVHDPARAGAFMPYGLRPTFHFGLGHAL